MLDFSPHPVFLLQFQDGRPLHVFTSESVNDGRPNKLCDQISDTVLDVCLGEDPHSCVVCETCMVMIFGEITTRPWRTTGRSSSTRFSTSATTTRPRVSVIVTIEQQSPDIAQSENTTNEEVIGADVQIRHQADLRAQGRHLYWIRSTGKTHVTVEYVQEGGRMILQRIAPRRGHKRAGLGRLMKHAIQAMIPGFVLGGFRGNAKVSLVDKNK